MSRFHLFPETEKTNHRSIIRQGRVGMRNRPNSCPTRSLLAMVLLLVALVVPIDSAYFAKPIQQHPQVMIAPGEETLKRNRVHHRPTRRLMYSSTKGLRVKRSKSEEEGKGKGKKRGPKASSKTGKKGKGGGSSKGYSGFAPGPAPSITAQPTCIECDDIPDRQGFFLTLGGGSLKNNNKSYLARLARLGIVVAFFVYLWFWLFWYVSIHRSRQAQSNGAKVLEADCAADDARTECQSPSSSCVVDAKWIGESDTKVEI